MDELERYQETWDMDPENNATAQGTVLAKVHEMTMSPHTIGLVSDATLLLGTTGELRLMGGAHAWKLGQAVATEL